MNNYRGKHVSSAPWQTSSASFRRGRHQVKNREKIISADVAALKEHDPRLGETWGGIMDYWDYANSELQVNTDKLPDDLPDDDSLCIVVLGFELNDDGSMQDELIGRLNVAMKCAEQYPNTQ